MSEDAWMFAKKELRSLKLAPLFAFLAGCPSVSPSLAAPPEGGKIMDGHYALIGGEVFGKGRVDIEIKDGWIVAVGKISPTARRIDVGDNLIVPGFIDSHVHLAYYPAERDLARGGIVGAVDLAAPIDSLAKDHSPLIVIGSGPMITSVRGYPTQGWGRNGYGLEGSGINDITKGIDSVVSAGAKLIKIPVGSEPTFTDAELGAAITHAHRRGLKVAVHALSDRDARRAGELGADILAHTPLEPLSEETLSLWKDRTVISTIVAFGGNRSTVDNMRRLNASGTTVLYGTDFGNNTTTGIDADELRHLNNAGLSPAQIIRAATSEAAAYWGMDDLGSIDVGKRASFLIIDGNPLDDLDLLTRPAAVLVDGHLISGSL